MKYLFKSNRKKYTYIYIWKLHQNLYRTACSYHTVLHCLTFGGSCRKPKQGGYVQGYISLALFGSPYTSVLYIPSDRAHKN